MGDPLAIPQSAAACNMEVIELVETMRNICIKLQRQAKQIRFVPTMGSLHAGHTALIERAAAKTGADAQVVVVVSIFVNPSQFNSSHDFLNYPKTLERDLAICRQTGLVDYVFAPSCREMYASSQSLAEWSCRVMPPSASCVANELEGASRPGHFEGMLTVVLKLFNIVQPDWAYFGEKDYQQLLLVQQMVRDLSLKTRICAVPTKRQADTRLPLSSRNGRLTWDQQRRAATVMFDILNGAKEELERHCREQQAVSFTGSTPEAPEPDPDTVLLSTRLVALALSDSTCQLVDNNSPDEPVEVDYVELRCAKDLSVIRFEPELGLFDCRNACVRRNKSDEISISGKATLRARLLIAVIIAKVRLLDNLEVRLNM